MHSPSTTAREYPRFWLQKCLEYLPVLALGMRFHNSPGRAPYSRGPHGG